MWPTAAKKWMSFAVDAKRVSKQLKRKTARARATERTRTRISDKSAESSRLISQRRLDYVIRFDVHTHHTIHSEKVKF